MFANPARENFSLSMQCLLLMNSAMKNFFLEISKLVMKTYKIMLTRPAKKRQERVSIQSIFKWDDGQNVVPLNWNFEYKNFGIIGDVLICDETIVFEYFEAFFDCDYVEIIATPIVCHSFPEFALIYVTWFVYVFLRLWGCTRIFQIICAVKG